MAKESVAKFTADTTKWVADQKKERFDPKDNTHRIKNIEDVLKAFPPSPNEMSPGGARLEHSLEIDLEK